MCAGWLQVVPINEPSGGGCSKGTTIASEDWENISDGEEWSNDGNWVENLSSTDRFVGDNSIVHGGSLSGQALSDSDDYDRGCRLPFTALGNTGYVTFEFYILADDATSGSQWDIYICDDAYGVSSNRRVGLMVDSGYLKVRDNDTYVNVVSMSSDTWYKVEVQIDLSASTGIDAVRIWVDGVEASGSPYDTYSRSDPGSGIDRFVVHNYFANKPALYIDDLLIYEGERCAN